MSDLLDKVKDKAKDVKDAVVDNTKDVVDAAKDSFNTTSSTSSSSVAYFHTPKSNDASSLESTYEGKKEGSNSSIEVKSVESPLTEHTESEQKVFSTNIKDSQSIKTANYDSTVFTNQQQFDKQQQQEDHKEYNEYFDPITTSIKLWQNYYSSWMNFYTRLLESFNRTTRNI